MILTCPECASRYFVDDARIGPGGRKVRCAACGHAWREGANAAEPPPAAIVTAPEPEPEPAKPRGVRADVSSRLREEAAEKRKTREAAAVGAVWAVLGAGFCILALCAVVFRTDVVRLLPATAGAYAFARLPVNPVGLSIEAVQGGPGLKDGRAALTVKGMERNVETHPRDARPVRISLLDKAGGKLVSAVASPDDGPPIQPGETRPFAVSFLDPPLQAASFQVEFAFDVAPAPRRPKGRPAPPSPPMPSAALKLRGAALAPPVPPVQAKDAAPLPADSPYALPAAAKPSHG